MYKFTHRAFVQAHSFFRPNLSLTNILKCLERLEECIGFIVRPAMTSANPPDISQSNWVSPTRLLKGSTSFSSGVNMVSRCNRFGNLLFFQKEKLNLPVPHESVDFLEYNMLKFRLFPQTLTDARY